MNKTDQTKV